MRTMATMLACASICLQALPVRADSGPLDHAPIGVMGDHTHKAGEWMFSYRYMDMHMGGNRDGSSRVSVSEVLQRYMVAPTSMTMKMHMLGAMYAPGDDLTFMIMLPYVQKRMHHVNRMGRQFTTESEGIGDTVFSALLPLATGAPGAWHANLGFSAPTGSIDARDDTPLGPDSPLPYPMQTGSGTWDLRPALTWNLRRAGWSAGAQAGAVIRLGRNDEDYALGNEYAASAWGAWRLAEPVSFSLRVRARSWEDIDGEDDALNVNLVPTADPHRRGGREVGLDLGLNLLLPYGHRLALELGAPLYQHLDGPQLETDSVLTLGWQKAL